MTFRRAAKQRSSVEDILVLVAVVLAAVLLVLFSASYLPTRMEAMHANWVKNVHIAVDGVRLNTTNERLEAVKQSLLSLTVAAPDKMKHLNLVLAVIALQDGKPDAIQRLNEALQAVGK